MTSGEMIVVNGVRYRPEDAKRLGLVADKADTDDQKQRRSAPNKARTSANTK